MTTVGIGDNGSDEDALSELALRRRLEAVEEASAPAPSFVTGVEQSEVRMWFNPLEMPLDYASIAEFRRELVEMYGVQPEKYDGTPFGNPTEEKELEYVESLKGTADLLLRFRSGRFPLRNNYTPILLIDVNFESVFVSVTGVSQVAEVIVGEVMALLWRLSGASKEWPAIEKTVTAVSYATGTRVQLPFPLERFLNSQLTGFFTENLADNKKYANRMGLTRKNALVERSYLATMTVKEISLRVAKFDPSSGDTADHPFKFITSAKMDHGSGRVLVQSNMAYDDHVDAVGMIIRAFGG